MTETSGETAIGTEQLIAYYGPDAMVKRGDFVTTLGSMLAAEAAFCSAEDAVRQDPNKRAAFLAGALDAAGTLVPEHQYLIPRAE